MMVDMVENFFDVLVDYFVKVNMESFRDVVDIFGGVIVNSIFVFSYDGYLFGKGEIMLNGKEVFVYICMRKEDLRGDFGCQDC